MSQLSRYLSYRDVGQTVPSIGVSGVPESLKSGTPHFLKPGLTFG